MILYIFIGAVVLVVVLSIVRDLTWKPPPSASQPTTYPRIVGMPDDARWSDGLNDWDEVIVEVAPRSYQIWKMDAAKAEAVDARRR